MRIERTTDAVAVSRIISHPQIRPLVWEGDDEPPVPLHDSIYYLLARDERYGDGAVEDVILGVVAFMPVNSITWNPHISVLPKHQGCGTEVMNCAVDWMFDHTPCRKMFSAPPVFNVRMVRVFEKCGFRREGLSPKSFQWRGEIHDRVLMGKEK